MRLFRTLLFAWGVACATAEREAPPSPVATPTAETRPSAANLPPAEPSERQRRPLEIVAGGDINLGRAVGRRILTDPAFDPFSGVRPLLAGADLSIANLESPLSDQGGETEDATRLAFVGPPGGAALLARAPFHALVLANNHVWDYGRRGFLDTLAALDGAGLRYAGVSREAGQEYRPLTLSVNGWSIALLAVTHLFNPGSFHDHEAKGSVAWADAERLSAEVRRARAEHDLVLVSYHGGREYAEIPAKEQREIARAVMEAGADAVLAHHPHVPQGIGWFGGRPVFYSLGNLVFGKHKEHAWTAKSFLAKLRFMPDGRIESAVCPYRIDRGLPQPAASLEWAGWERVFARRVRETSSYASVGGTAVGAPDEKGCLPVEPGL